MSKVLKKPNKLPAIVVGLQKETNKPAMVLVGVDGSFTFIASVDVNFRWDVRIFHKMEVNEALLREMQFVAEESFKKSVLLGRYGVNEDGLWDVVLN